ncbi:hypothetical protein Scep_028640 [Stephania cephalantha]|uniref:Receptor-like serine/threonine-protein kinase n=1 Tax=Stephania cephalantha TaxID=152367 RepID=A0AAP0EHM5_9MAGN
MASFISLLLLFNLFVHKLCYAADTINHNNVLRDGDTLVSNGGIFALGFFSPGNSKQRYVGIWYNKIPGQTVVWVANRDNPINNNSSSGVVKVDELGKLAIFNANSSPNPLWSANISATANTTSSTLSYKLLDTGNLVLRDENQGDFLWQSFDYPTDAFLPGMKLGFNKKTGLSWSLTSWKSPDDPSTGEFTLGMDLTGLPELVIKKASQKIWRTGPWAGEGFNGVPGMGPNPVVNFSFVDNPDEIYYSHSYYNTNTFSRIMFDYLGFDRTLIWIESTGRWVVIRTYPDDICDSYGKCGAFGSCRPNNQPTCLCLSGFEPSDGSTADGSAGVNNCSCTGYASAYVNGSGCLVWFGDLTDMREFTNGGQDFFVRVNAIEIGNSIVHSKGSFTKKKLVITLCVVIVVGLLIFISGFCYFFKKAKGRGILQRKRLQKQLLKPSPETNEETNTKFELPIFDLNSMMVATENFSLTNELGAGGFGSVYKGTLCDGREIAVKRLSKNSGQGVIEFKNEVELIAKLQHRNLVQIIGCCIEEEEKMLIYEYMPNKSLDFLLAFSSWVAIYHSFPIPGVNLQHAWELWIDGRVLESVDLTIGNSFPEKEVVRFIQVGILCVQENAKDRPTMYNVIFMLSNERPIPSPKQPAFVLISNHNSANASASPSINEMSITIVEGR